jgi:hypothetical protein
MFPSYGLCVHCHIHTENGTVCCGPKRSAQKKNPSASPHVKSKKIPLFSQTISQNYFSKHYPLDI